MTAMSLRALERNNAAGLQLQHLIGSGKVVHAFLFLGDKESRLAIGKELAKAILCEDPREGDSCGACVSCRKFDHGNHEDFLYLDLETAAGSAKTQIGVEAVDQLQQQLKLKPFGKRHVALLEEAHLLNTAAQNKLLKTLEEPAGDSVLILLADRKDALLPTVVSRCSTYYLEDSPSDADEDMTALVRDFFALCAGKALFYRKRDCLKPLLEEKNEPREKAAAFLESLELLLRDALVSPYEAQIGPSASEWPAFEELCAQYGPEALSRAIPAVEEASRSIKLGYNTGYTLKKLCLTI